MPTRVYPSVAAAAFVVSGLGTMYTSLTAAESSADLARDVARILEKNCAKCHGRVGSQANFNVGDHASLVTPKTRKGKEVRYVAPTDVRNSLVWQRIGEEKDMPPDAPLSPTDLERVRSWIAQGAVPFPAETNSARPFLDTITLLQAVNADLRKRELPDRKFMRYFSLAHLHNNSTVTNRDLAKFRAALAKLINSLSWESDIVVPEAIDAHAVLLRVDLRSVGWDRDNLWRTILLAYPYGLTHSTAKDERLRTLASEVYEWTGTELPILRADWFVATAAVPPLYHRLLQLPDRDADLERRLGVRVEADFLNDRVRRAGVLQSKVSRNGRVVDRFPSLYGAYWKSYDFKSSERERDVSRYPLGPVFANNPNSAEAFVHDGGEIIFALPNGLQGYLIVNGRGQRIDEAPVEVVEDKNGPLLSSVVVNGISCMACHKAGMQRVKDAVRQGHSLGGSGRVKVERLFAPQEELDRLLDKDEKRFQKALAEAVSPFLAKDERAAETAEPIGAISRFYCQDLGITDVMAELGVRPKEEDVMRRLFETNPFAPFGLGVLANGDRIKREVWHKCKTFSRFQEVADALAVGVPFRIFGD